MKCLWKRIAFACLRFRLQHRQSGELSGHDIGHDKVDSGRGEVESEAKNVTITFPQPVRGLSNKPNPVPTRPGWNRFDSGSGQLSPVGVGHGHGGHAQALCCFMT